MENDLLICRSIFEARIVLQTALRMVAERREPNWAGAILYDDGQQRTYLGWACARCDDRYLVCRAVHVDRKTAMLNAQARLLDTLIAAPMLKG